VATAPYLTLVPVECVVPREVDRTL
jgi:hypothetical protein